MNDIEEGVTRRNEAREASRIRESAQAGAIMALAELQGFNIIGRIRALKLALRMAELEAEE